MRFIVCMLHLAFLVLTGYFNPILGQKQTYIDSVYQLSYDVFKENIVPKQKRSSEYPQLLNRLLEKSKYKNEVLKQADYYYLLSEISTKEKALSYLDSIIVVTQDLKDYNYPAKAYLKKAGFYGAQGNYDLAMQAVMKADSLAIARKNKDQEFAVKYYIALLKDDIGEKEEALHVLKLVKKYYQEKFYLDNSYVNRSKFFQLLYAVGDSYYRTQNYDSAHRLSSKGIQLSLQYKDSIYYSRFLLSSGISYFGMGEYNKAIDSLFKYKKIQKKDPILPSYYMVPDMFLGMANYKNEAYDKALPYLKKVDSVIFTNHHFTPDQRPVFEFLMDYYKRTGNTEKQLYQINRLISFDSIINLNYKNIQKKIASNYETPKLISRKQQLITELEKKSKSKSKYLWGIVFLCIAFLSLFVWNYLKKNTYKKRIQKIINDLEENDKAKNTPENKPKVTHEDLDIPEEVIKNTLNSLDQFESEKRFLEHSISIQKIAKDLGTNSRYLSKIINTYKEKTFSNYINDLRIQHVIKRLKDETQFRNYKMTVIAKESGFNTQQAFSKSFYKKTGVHPSFFIKELNKTSP